MARVWAITEEYGPIETSTSNHHEIMMAAGHMRTLGRYFRGELSEREASEKLASFEGETINGDPLETDIDAINELYGNGQMDDVEWESAGYPE